MSPKKGLPLVNLTRGIFEWLRKTLRRSGIPLGMGGKTAEREEARKVPQAVKKARSQQYRRGPKGACE